ncbi:MAG TPA: GAP family protein [Patescibacteria group bacterium]|nr:GAP family protein [Patescibacteria group bacterium]
MSLIAVSSASCTRIACWLSTQGGLVSFPLITIAGLVDGINPCAIGMMVMLLGYLLVFGQGSKKNIERRMLVIGLIYILSVFLTYLAVGLLFYSSVSQLHLDTIRQWFNPTLGVLLIIAGAIQIKDFFKPEWPIHLRIPTASKAKLMPLIEKSSIPATIVLGVLVTLLETPCSLPIYVGTATILAQSGLILPLVVGYFFYYNFLFVLPLIVVLVVVWRAKKVIEMKEWEHSAEKWMKLAIGVVLSGLGLWLLR